MNILESEMKYGIYVMPFKNTVALTIVVTQPEAGVPKFWYTYPQGLVNILWAIVSW